MVVSTGSFQLEVGREKTPVTPYIVQRLAHLYFTTYYKLERWAKPIWFAYTSLHPISLWAHKSSVTWEEEYLTFAFAYGRADKMLHLLSMPHISLTLPLLFRALSHASLQARFRSNNSSSQMVQHSTTWKPAHLAENSSLTMLLVEAGNDERTNLIMVLHLGWAWPGNDRRIKERIFKGECKWF